MARRFLLSGLVALSLSSLAFSQACYYPDGSQASHTPCNTTSSDTVSPCCGANTMCLKNGYCNAGGQIFRGSCTSKDFSPPCAQECLDSTSGSGMPISPCNQSVFFCDWASKYDGQCDDPSRSFTLASEDTGIILRPDQAAFLDSPIIDPYTVLSVSNTSDPGSSSAIISSTETTSIPAATTSAAQPDASCPAQSDTYSAATVAGVAVGIGVPLLLALAGAVFVILRQKRQLKLVEEQLDPAGSNEKHGRDGMYDKRGPPEMYATPPEADSSNVCEVEGSAASGMRY